MSETTPAATSGRSEPAPPPARTTVGEAARAVAVATSVGAAVIHFAHAPGHAGAAAPVFFLTVAWAQALVAAALAGWRRARWPCFAAAAVNAAVAVVWIASRTTGLPGSGAEPVGFPDALATELEAATVFAALVATRPALARRSVARVDRVVAGGAALALMVLVSASVTPPLAGDHGHGHDGGAGEAAAGAGGGHDHAPAGAGAVDRDARCDLGFNTAAFNDTSAPGVPHAHDDTHGVDFTLAEWAEVFVDPASGLTPAVVADAIESRPAWRDAVLGGGLAASLGPDPWNPMTDPEACAALAGELATAKAVASRYPTIADAEAAGYRRVTDYLPGIAAHFINPGHVANGFVVEEPEMLLYDGDGPDANIVGLSYYILGEGDEEPAEGFTGDNDHYHRHIGLCLRDGVVIAGSTTSTADCEALGGRKSDGSNGWMSHVWITPGCESDWGVFSGANPRLTVRGPDDAAPRPPGCGSGRTMADDLAFDTRGDGPRV